MRRGDGRPGPEGPQPAAVHPAGAEGRPPREERAQGQSVHAAGGAGLLQKVLTGTFISICAGVLLTVAKPLMFTMVCFSVTRRKMRRSLPVRLPHRNRGLALDLRCSQSRESNACKLSPIYTCSVVPRYHGDTCCLTSFLSLFTMVLTSIQGDVPTDGPP